MLDYVLDKTIKIPFRLVDKLDKLDFIDMIQYDQNINLADKFDMIKNR